MDIKPEMLDFIIGKPQYAIGWGIAAFIMLIIYGALMFIRIGDNYRLSGKNRIIALTVSLLMSLWFWRVAYAVHKGGCSDSDVFECLIGAIKNFAVDESFRTFAPNVSVMLCHWMPWLENVEFLVRAAVTLLYFAAPVTGVAMVLEIVMSGLVRVKLVWYAFLKNYKTVYYFSALNKKTYAYAKSIREGQPENNEGNRAIIVFCDAYIDDEAEESSELYNSAKTLGAVCIKDDIHHIAIRKGKKKVIIFMDDVSTNIHSIMTLMEKDISHKEKRRVLNDTNALVLCDERTYGLAIKKLKDKVDSEYKNNSFIITTIDEYGNMIKNALRTMPLYEPLIGTDDKGEMYFTIIGGGRIGTEMFLSAYWYGQILGYRLNITVVSMEEEKSFIDKINYINPEIFATAYYVSGREKAPVQGFCEKVSRGVWRSADYSKVMKLYPDESECASPYFTFRYFQTDICDADLYHKLENPHWSDEFRLRDTHYFAIAIGSDEDNISVMEKINKYINVYHMNLYGKNEASRKNTIIACAVYDSALSSVINRRQEEYATKWGVYIHAFADFESVYSVDNITMRNAKKDYDIIGSAYEKRKNGIRNKDGNDMSQYKNISSNARALHIIYKMFSTGFINSSVFTSGSVEARDKNNQGAGSKYKRYIEQICANLKADKATEEEKSIYNRLGWLEHRRWCAALRTTGFSAADDFSLYAKNNPLEHKEMILKLHPFLVECDERGRIGEWPSTGEKVDMLDYRCLQYNAFYKDKADNCEKEAEGFSGNNDTPADEIREITAEKCSKYSKYIKRSTEDIKAYDFPDEDFSG